MAELATIARPYAQALYQAVRETARSSEVKAWDSQIAAIAAVAADPDLRQFADNPKTLASQVYDLVVAAARLPLAPEIQNFLRTVIDNGRLAALPHVAEQFHHLLSADSGVSDATVFSAFPIEPAGLADLQAVLQKRFGRQLEVTVIIDPELIGGVRVVVGDEVLDTSVKARLERMKVALTA